MLNEAMIFIILLFCVMVWQACAAEGTGRLNKDVLAVKKRILQELIPDDPNSAAARKLCEDVKKYTDEIKPDGSWPDIDYTNKSKEKWESVWHTKRLYEMAIVYKSKGLPLSGQTQLRDKVLKGTTFWLAEDTRARGWYHQQLFVPHSLGKVCLLLDKEMPAEHLEATLKRLRERSSFAGKQNLRTGSNLLSFARNNVLLGCLESSPKTIALAFQHAGKELKVTTKDGVQPDRSFHQHGSCLHMSTYGATYSLNFARLAWLGQGTAFGFPKEKLELLFEFILDGQQWFVRGQEFDFLGTGRAFARQHSMHTPGPSRLWQNVAEIRGLRQAERRKFHERMVGSLAPGEGAPVGNKFFWRSAMMVHRRKDYYVSVRMLSRDLPSTDKVNYENLFGHHLSDGAMCLMRSGNEYAGIYPLWNWRGIPGTTVEEGNPPLVWEKLRTRGVRLFVGGASDGLYGVAAMDFARGPLTGEWLRQQKSRRINAKTVTLTARKAWFFLDRQIVCLGAGITGKSGKPVMTTLNQCRLNGKVSVSKGLKLGKDAADFTGPAWVHHDGFGYFLPGEAPAHLETKEKAGSWERINRSRPGKEITDSVFNLWLDHGKKPTGVSYVYHIVPGVTASSMADYAGGEAIEILSNTAKLQAVRHKKLKITAAAFYAPGKLASSVRPEILVDASCILLVREVPVGKLRVAFAKPDVRGDKPVAVTVSVGGQPLKFTPPSGVNKGKSLVKELEK